MGECDFLKDLDDCLDWCNVRVVSQLECRPIDESDDEIDFNFGVPNEMADKLERTLASNKKIIMQIENRMLTGFKICEEEKESEED